MRSDDTEKTIKYRCPRQIIFPAANHLRDFNKDLAFTGNASHFLESPRFKQELPTLPASFSHMLVLIPKLNTLCSTNKQFNFNYFVECIRAEPVNQF